VNRVEAATLTGAQRFDVVVYVAAPATLEGLATRRAQGVTAGSTTTTAVVARAWGACEAAAAGYEGVVICDGVGRADVHTRVEVPCSSVATAVLASEATGEREQANRALC
jgi:hypothetical protein